MSLKQKIDDLRKYRTAAFVLFVFCMVATFSFLATSNMQDLSAASTSEFKPGNIISDAVMANYNSMSVSEIQNFLTNKNSCKNTNYNQYLSLKAQYPHLDWHFENGHFVCLSEERFGDGEVIGSGQTAAEVIYQASQDYRINPQVLLVLLEKEQSLISDTYPNTRQYRSATGYGCPDTAACSAKYYGFKNQVRNAAALFRDVLDRGYSAYPEKTKGVYIGYNPNSACGRSEVYIENRATAALYRYTPYQPNVAALAAGYGTGDGCSAYGNRNFYLFFVDWFGSTQNVPNQIDFEAVVQNDLTFEYQTHVANIGWQESKAGGVAAGTTGQSRQLEAFNLNLGNNNSSIVYRAHVQNIGWESDWHHGGESAGTTGQGKAVEAIQIQLLDNLAEQYDIYYRVHAAGIGWMGWTKNGDPAGTTGESRKLEAIQVAIVKKGTTPTLPAGATETPFRSDDGGVSRYMTITYQAHTAFIGWMNWVGNGQIAGTTGQSRQMEALNLKTIGDNSNGIQYRTYVRGLGWMNWAASSQVAGTVGESRPIEAIEIRLPDNLVNSYAIRYRAHVSDIGWMDWAQDGQTAGTINQSHQIEAIEIQLVGK